MGARQGVHPPGPHLQGKCSPASSGSALSSVPPPLQGRSLSGFCLNSWPASAWSWATGRRCSGWNRGHNSGLADVAPGPPPPLLSALAPRCWLRGGGPPTPTRPPEGAHPPRRLCSVRLSWRSRGSRLAWPQLGQSGLSGEWQARKNPPGIVSCRHGHRRSCGGQQGRQVVGSCVRVRARVPVSACGPRRCWEQRLPRDARSLQQQTLFSVSTSLSGFSSLGTKTCANPPGVGRTGAGPSQENLVDSLRLRKPAHGSRGVRPRAGARRPLTSHGLSCLTKRGSPGPCESQQASSMSIKRSRWTQMQVALWATVANGGLS